MKFGHRLALLALVIIFATGAWVWYEGRLPDKVEAGPGNSAAAGPKEGAARPSEVPAPVR